MTDADRAERRYGCWAGNPNGTAEDVTRCVEDVPSTIACGMVFRQCGRERGHGPDGLYCKQHAKRADRRHAAR